MTIGSDQLDEWGRRLIECDELYREVQLLIRINPEGYTVDHDAIAAVGVANAEGIEDADMLHPIAFAKHWAWHLAAEARTIPPLTNKWITLIRYVSAHLQYLGRDDREEFGLELKRLRGMLGALVNENRLAQGEADALTAINAHGARRALKAWALTSDRHMKRKDLARAFPTLTDREWAMLRKRKERSPENIPAYHYPVRWAAEIAPQDNAPIPVEAQRDEYRDVMDVRPHPTSLDALAEDSVYIDRDTGILVDVRKGKRKTQEDPESL